MEQRAARVKPGPRQPHISGLWRWVVVAAVAAGLAAAAGIPAPAGDRVQTTGDEPHYLLTADALAREGTLDIGPAYRQQRYRAYHDAGLPSQAAPRPDGRLLAPHDPLLPVLLALPMRLGGWVAAKATLALVAAALAALLVHTAAARAGVAPRVAGIVTIVFTAAPPLATYGAQVYPELPAALAVAAAVAALTGRLRARGVAAVVAAVVALPWLGVKYVPLAAVLALVAAVRLWRAGRRRPALVLGGTLVVAAGAYLAAHLAWYGGPTVYAAGSFFQEHGGELSVVGTRPDYRGRATRLVGLLVDAEFGLAAWQPAWLLAVPALSALVARGRAGALDRPALVAPLLAGWVTATFLAATMHGWWFPGRQVVCVLPVLVLATAAWAGDRGARLRWVAGLGAAGVAGHAWLVAEGWLGTTSWVVGVLETTSPVHQVMRGVLPAYRQADATTWGLHAAWLVVLAVLAAWGWLSARRARRVGAALMPGVARPEPGVVAAAPDLRCGPRGD